MSAVPGDLGRLLSPGSVAVVGGGAWCESVVRQCIATGFAGPVWPVHPSKPEIGGVAAFKDLADLPGIPDAVFIGVNRAATVEVVRRLSAAGAGGAVCFASGFLEAAAETGDGADMQAALLEAAGAMPILGPNCYGFVNCLDGAALWPDQHGGARVESGVAILSQSSNIAINLTMQARALPVGYMITVGNQAQTGFAALGEAVLSDPRVTALGMFIEGVGDLRAFEGLAAAARRLGKPVAALKTGKSESARAAAISHTASLAGSESGGRALMARLGIAQADSLPQLLETLKLLHYAGPLASRDIAAASCSGGEASLVADCAQARDLIFPQLSDAQRAALREALGPMVALANPLDYHTFVWRDVPKMAQTFSAMASENAALALLVADFPRPDRCDPSDWDCILEAAGRAAESAAAPIALVATLPETMPEAVAQRAVAAGLVPMHGLEDAIAAAEAAAWLGRPRADPAPLLLPGDPQAPRTLGEAEAKAALRAHGVATPASSAAATPPDAVEAARRIGFPVALKGAGVAHKSEAGLVALSLGAPEEVAEAAGRMRCDGYLVEEMVSGAVAELLVGVVRDPAHGYALTLAAGGVLAEILDDSATLLLPVSAEEALKALDGLRIGCVLRGHRGALGADMAAIARTVLAVQDYVAANAGRLEEVEINPLLCMPEGAVAADALIRVGEAGGAQAAQGERHG